MLTKFRNTVTQKLKLFSFCMLALLSLCAVAAQASDVAINPTGPVFSINNLIWGTAGSGGFNNNYWFSPLYTSESVCVFVYNNNTSNPHTFTAQISYTGNVQSTSPADGTWSTYNSAVSLTTATSPSPAAIIGASTSGAALVSINFSGSSSQAGSPDTANVRVVQTTNGSCMITGRSFTSGTLSSDASGQAAADPIQVISDNISQSFGSAVITTNPVINQVILHINANSGSRSLYPRHVFVSCSANCNFIVDTTNSLGTTCTTNPPTNLKVGSLVTTSGTSNFGCATPPSISIQLYNVYLSANSFFDVDLSGIVLSSGTNSGVDVLMNTALTGTINSSFRWYEK